MMALLGRAALGLPVLAAGLAGWSALAARGAARVVPRDGALIDVAGARLHYVDRGQGRPILLIHGLGGQLRNFTHSLTALLEDEFRVVAVDRPGYGYSTYTAPGQPTLERQARIMAAFIRATGLERPLVVGHSLGGALALRLAQMHPELISGLALICPLTQPIDRPPDVFKGLVIPSAAVRRAVSWTLAVPLGQWRAEDSARAVFAPEAVPPDFIDRGGGALSLRPSSVWSASTEVTTIAPEVALMAEGYATLDVPVGIVFARDDHILDPTLHGARTAAALPRARLELVPGGHMVPVTAPDSIARFIRDQTEICAPA